jgi:UDP-glucose 4-epimerase
VTPILLNGGAGSIGGHGTGALHAAGFAPTIIGDLSETRRDLPA